MVKHPPFTLLGDNMSINKDLFGITYAIPVQPEQNWGATVTALLQAIMGGLDGNSTLVGVVPILKLVSTSTTLADGATLTQSHPIHLVDGSGGPVTLSLATPITVPTANQLLILVGTDDTNSVTIEDGGTVKLNGEIVLGEYDILVLVYNTTKSLWIEITRNN